MLGGASLNQYQQTLSCGNNGATATAAAVAAMSQALNNLKTPANNILLQLSQYELLQKQLMAATAAASTNSPTNQQPSTKENLNSMNNNMSHLNGFNGLNAALQYSAGLLALNQNGVAAAGLANMGSAALFAAAKQQAANVLYENMLQQNRKLLLQQQQQQHQQQQPSGFDEQNGLAKG